MASRWRWWVVSMTVLLALGGCESAPAGALEFRGPMEQTVQAGDPLPGTNIRFIGYTDQGAQVTIDGQAAIKKVGDSLDWRGQPAPGLDVEMGQRVVTANAQRLITVGTVRVVVHEPEPAAAQVPDKPALSYAVATVYNVPRGERIPGTTISYQGKNESGAQLGGVSGYAFRKVGDSITWRGRLRAGVYLDTTLRVVAYQDDALQVAGTATIAVAANEVMVPLARAARLPRGE